jgi:hypothetical protein
MCELQTWAGSTSAASELLQGRSGSSLSDRDSDEAYVGETIGSYCLKVRRHDVRTPRARYSERWQKEIVGNREDRYRQRVDTREGEERERERERERGERERREM